MSWEQELGKSIRSARGKKRWTQQQLGESLGVHENTIRSYEQGNSSPDFGDILKISNVLEQPYFEVGDGLRVEFNRNGHPGPQPLPQQLNFEFDAKEGVNIRIEAVSQGLIIKKIPA